MTQESNTWQTSDSERMNLESYDLDLLGLLVDDSISSVPDGPGGLTLAESPSLQDPHQSLFSSDSLSSFGRSMSGFMGLAPILSQDFSITSQEFQNVPSLDAIPKNLGQSWPFDYSCKESSRKLQLPPLHHLLLRTVWPGGRSISKPSSETFKGLIHLMSQPLLSPPSNGNDLEISVAADLLRQCLDLYISEFHPILPLIHIPSWDIKNCPTVLLAAMACIGARFCKLEGASDIARVLSEIAVKTLSWMV